MCGESLSRGTLPGHESDQLHNWIPSGVEVVIGKMGKNLEDVGAMRNSKLTTDGICIDVEMAWDMADGNYDVPA